MIIMLKYLRHRIELREQALLDAKPFLSAQWSTDFTPLPRHLHHGSVSKDHECHSSWQQHALYGSVRRRRRNTNENPPLGVSVHPLGDWEMQWLARYLRTLLWLGGSDHLLATRAQMSIIFCSWKQALRKINVQAFTYRLFRIHLRSIEKGQS